MTNQMMKGICDMKKLLVLLMAALLMLALCACGESVPPAETQSPEETPDSNISDYGELYFKSGETSFGIMDEAEPVLAALGEPDDTFESASCAYQGMDCFYYYDGFEIMVNDVDGVQRITGVTLSDDTVSTPQGVRIGMNVEEAIGLMGDIGYSLNGDVYSFEMGPCAFLLRVDAENSITAVEYSVKA